MELFIALLFLLVVGHALADYPLQGEFLATAKDHKTQVGRHIWPWALSFHAMIHGGLVYAITGVAWIGLLEVAVHAGIDWAKTHNYITFNVDQWLHLGCKVVWVVIVLLLYPTAPLIHGT